MTTGYHYHGEKRKREDDDKQWRAGFRRWMNAQIQLVKAKDAKNESLTPAESAVKIAHYYMTRKVENAA